jgi:hypothetical protein
MRRWRSAICKAEQSPGLDLLSPRDIIDMLKETLPRKPEGKDALVRRINETNVTSGGWAPSNPVSAPQQNHSRHSQ